MRRKSFELRYKMLKFAILRGFLPFKVSFSFYGMLKVDDTSVFQTLFCLRVGLIFLPAQL